MGTTVRALCHSTAVTDVMRHLITDSAGMKGGTASLAVIINMVFKPSYPRLEHRQA